ncbi:PiggyBac transposable element-derived protein 4 [Anthophora retusa]
MAKRKLPQEVFGETDNSDEEFYFGLLNTDSDRESDNDCSDSDSDIVPVKRRVRQLTISSDSETEGNDENENSNINEFTTWRDVTYTDQPQSKTNFSTGSKTVGPNVPLNCTEPIDFFRLFFTDTLLEKIVLETNKYAQNRIAAQRLSARSTWNKWLDVTKEELTAFLGVVLNMGTIPIPSMKYYWTKDYVGNIPFFRDMFRKERFFQILWMLHLNENVSTNRNVSTRIQKVSNFLDYIVDKFQAYFTPDREISIDESVVKFKGKISFITYNPKKPTKWGIRIYVLSDAHTGYTYAMLPYYGSVTTDILIRPDLPVSSRIVLQLYHTLLTANPEAKGYHIFTDRYFTGIPLARELLKLSCYLTGTINTNRKYVPAVIKKPAVTKNNTVAAYRSGDILLLAWKDKRIVTILSSYDTSGTTIIERRKKQAGTVNIIKPNVIINYNMNMGGVDKADQLASSYCFMRKSCKWWRKLFFWGLEVCAINSYILYKVSARRENRTPMSHFIFVRKLVAQLVGDFRDGADSKPGRPSTSVQEERLNGKLHILRHCENVKSKDCSVCSNRKIKGGRH